MNSKTDLPLNVGVLQWKYTSSRFNIERSTGFFTFSMSERLTKEEKEELIEYAAHYDAPDSFPKQPTLEELSAFPVAFSYFHLKNGKSVICRTQYVGKDYASSRYGNFFAHALVLENGDWDKPLDYLNSVTFARGLTSAEQSLTTVPPSLPELARSEVRLSNAFSPYDTVQLSTSILNIVSRIVDGFFNALKNKCNLVVFLDDKNLNKYPTTILAAFLKILPKEIARKVTFSTYVHDPTYDQLVNARDAYCFIAFSPSSSIPETHGNRFISVDLSQEAIKRPYKIKNIYARRLILNASFLETVAQYPYPCSDETNSSINVESKEHIQERDNDFAYLMSLGVIDELLNGTLTDLDSLNYAWSYLYGTDKAITDRFITELLKKDYSDCKNALFSKVLLRELLAFVVRSSVDVAQLVDLQQHRQFLSAICNFWTRHIPQGVAENKAWRQTTFEEIQKIFGNDNIATKVSKNTHTPFKKYSTLPFQEELLAGDLSEPTTIWLCLSLFLHAALGDPGHINGNLLSKLTDAYRRLVSDSDWAREFDFVYFSKFAQKIVDLKSYTVLNIVLGQATLDRYVDRQIAQAKSYWAQGSGVPAETEDTETDRPRSFDSDDNEDQPIVVESMEAMGARRFGGTGKISGKRTNKTSLPGADAYILWLLKQGKYSEIANNENLFGTFSRKDLKRAREYFSNLSNKFDPTVWDALERHWGVSFLGRLKNMFME